MSLVRVDEPGPCIGCALPAWQVEPGDENSPADEWTRWHEFCFWRYVVKPAPVEDRRPA